MFNILKVIILGMMFSSIAVADYDDWDDRPERCNNNQGYYQPVAPGYYPGETMYVPQRVIRYKPLPPQYYAPPPQYYYDQRPPVGLLGAIVGGMMEFGPR